jgi:hypothetical protein
VKGIEGIVVIHNGALGTGGDIGAATVCWWTSAQLNLPLDCERREGGLFDRQGTVRRSAADTTTAGRSRCKSRRHVIVGRGGGRRIKDTASSSSTTEQWTKAP